MEMKGNEKKVKEALHQLARPNQSLGVTSLMGGLHFRGFLASVKKIFFFTQESCLLTKRPSETA